MTDDVPTPKPMEILLIANATGKVNERAASCSVPSCPTKYVSTNEVDKTAKIPKDIGHDKLKRCFLVLPKVRSVFLLLIVNNLKLLEFQCIGFYYLDLNLIVIILNA